MTILLLVLLALLPGALLMYLIMYMDRNEREPMGLVLKTMMLGALGFAPAVLAENALAWIPTGLSGGLPAALWDSFVRISPIEELSKLAPVMLLAWNHPHFNEENDGIVYAGASALGFAAVENLFYVLSRGFAVGLGRALTSVPLHCFAGVVMGYYIGRARFAPSGSGRLIAAGFFLAYLAHGIYDTLALSGSLLALALLPMVAAIMLIGLAVLRRGRALSLERSPTARAETAEPGAVTARPAPAPKRQGWKAAVGRSLLGLCATFWALLALGLAQETEPGTAPKIIIGGLLLTFIPALIGVTLEISYRKGRTGPKVMPGSINA